MDCSLPDFSVHWILQARILEWVAIHSSRGSSSPSNWTRISYVSCIGRRVFFFFFFTTELPGKPYGDLFLDSTRLNPVLPFKARLSPHLSGLLQDLLQEDKEVARVPAHQLLQAPAVQTQPSWKERKGQGSAQGWRELGIPGAALGHYLLMEESQKILDKHTGPYQAPSR